MKDMKAMARPFLALYAMALVIALLGRIGLAVAGDTGVLAFDYISASGVPVLDVICSILTGSAFVAFLFAAGLALCVSTAGAVLYGALASRAEGDAGAPAVRPRPLTAFLWGWATALVAIACLLVTVSGILSAVQVASMSSKLPGTAVLVVALVGFAAFLGTLLGAASMTVSACLARKRPGRALVVATLGCGLVVMVLTVGTFAAINTASINLAAVGGWFAADLAVNLIILFAANALAKKATASKPVG